MNARLGQRNQPAQQPQGQPGSERAKWDTIDFVYNQNVEGDLAANAHVDGTGYTRIVGNHETANNEIMEVVAIEYIPPTNADDSIQTIQHVRLWDGDNLYPDLRYRTFMMGYFGGANRFRTPPLAPGNPVLSGRGHPDRGKFNTAFPKYGTSTGVSPRVTNDGTAITDSFRVRLYVWRWKGSDAELQDFFQDAYGTTTFRQNVSLSNPFTGAQQSFQRSSPIRIQDAANITPHRQFTTLMGGINQATPKARPWVTWSENNQQTTANQEYKFTETNNRVNESWKELDFDLTDGDEARIFDYLMVQEAVNLEEGVLVFDERDEDPDWQLTATDAFELPLVQPLDGRTQPHDVEQLPRRLSDDLMHRQVLWNDGGGFRIIDDGNQIPGTPGNRVLVGVQGQRLVLTS